MLEEEARVIAATQTHPHTAVGQGRGRGRVESSRVESMSLAKPHEGLPCLACDFRHHYKRAPRHSCAASLALAPPCPQGPSVRTRRRHSASLLATWRVVHK